MTQLQAVGQLCEGDPVTDEVGGGVQDFGGGVAEAKVAGIGDQAGEAGRSELGGPGYAQSLDKILDHVRGRRAFGSDPNDVARAVVGAVMVDDDGATLTL